MNVRELRKIIDYINFDPEDNVDMFEVEARVAPDSEWTIVDKVQVGGCVCEECGCEIPDDTVVLCGGSCDT